MGQENHIIDPENCEIITLSDGSKTVGAASKAVPSSLVGYRPTPYALTVQNGSGSGNLKFGEAISIQADAAPSGKTFDKWVLVSGSGSFKDASNTTTVFTAGGKETVIKATYKDMPSSQPENPSAASPSSLPQSTSSTHAESSSTPTSTPSSSTSSEQSDTEVSSASSSSKAADEKENASSESLPQSSDTISDIQDTSSSPLDNPPSYSSLGTFFLIAGIVIFLAAAAFGAWWFCKKHNIRFFKK